MSAEHASQDTSPTLSKESATCPERDGRKTAQNDGSSATPNNPPNHGKSTNPGEPNTFLEWCHPDTPVEPAVLQEKWDYWHPRSVDDKRKPQKDRAPTWDTVDTEGWSQ